MGYRITYYQNRIHKRPIKKRGKLPWAGIISGALALLLLCGGWRWLLPGNARVTEAALGQLVENVRAGEPMGEAITVFCREIIANGRQN